MTRAVGRLGQNRVMASTKDGGASDRWLALLAGHTTWIDSERPTTISLRSTGGVQLFALIVLICMLICYVAAADDRGVRALLDAGPLLLTGATALAIIGPARTLLGRIPEPQGLWRNLVLRGALGLAMAIGLFASAPGWAALLSWTVGVALGADVSLTAYTMGWNPSPWQWWRSFVLSPLHLGVLGGLAGTAIAGPDIDLRSTMLPMFVTLHAWLIIACTTAWSIGRVIDAEQRADDAIRAETARLEHRRSAHWLHDDICAQLRLVTLKVQRGDVHADEVVGMLDELDFALRLRQLDEVLQSGSVRLAEVIQPFVRNAQSHGATVERVPSYEVASTQLGRHTGYAVRRAAAVMTSNALNAGATRIGYSVELRPRDLVLTVTDDAGGFPGDEFTPGRGLWSLEHELGPGSVAIGTAAGGSHVSVRIPLSEASA